MFSEYTCSSWPINSGDPATWPEESHYKCANDRQSCLRRHHCLRSSFDLQAANRRDYKALRNYEAHHNASGSFKNTPHPSKGARWSQTITRSLKFKWLESSPTVELSSNLDSNLEFLNFRTLWCRFLSSKWYSDAPGWRSVRSVRFQDATGDQLPTSNREALKYPTNPTFRLAYWCDYLKLNLWKSSIESDRWHDHMIVGIIRLIRGFIWKYRLALKLMMIIEHEGVLLFEHPTVRGSHC